MAVHRRRRGRFPPPPLPPPQDQSDRCGKKQTLPGHFWIPFGSQTPSPTSNTSLGQDLVHGSGYSQEMPPPPPLPGPSGAQDRATCLRPSGPATFRLPLGCVTWMPTLPPAPPPAAPPAAVNHRSAVGGGCQSGCGRLLSVPNAIEAGAWRQGDSGWAYAGCLGRGGGGSTWQTWQS